MSGTPQTERRQYNKTLAEVEDAFDRKLRDHEVREQERIQQMIDTLKSESFPDGPAAHKLAHIFMMEKAKAETEFWRGLTAGLAQKSIWGILQVLLFLLFAGLAAKFGLGSLVTGMIK